MSDQKYLIEKETLSNILGYIKSGQIAIPELQRPFVWNQNQITQLIDSLYNELPTGFIVVWENGKIRLKDGSLSSGKKIIIDGQQRITAIRTALLGEEVSTEDYSTRRFMVAFDLFNEKFETHKPIHDKSSRWVPDISIFFKEDKMKDRMKFVRNYIEANADLEGIDEDFVLERIDKLKSIVQREIGVIKLSSNLSIIEATNIFNLMNSKGTRLGQEDYIMAKLSSNSTYEGYYIWKTIDYFCKGMHDKKFIKEIPEKDADFANTEYYKAIKWVLKSNVDFVYTPTYNDILRVIYGIGFHDGLLKRLSDLIDGRNFKKKSIEEAIAEDTFKKLKAGLFAFVNENNYKEFNLCIVGTGVKHKKLINSQSSLNMAYIIWLSLKEGKEVEKTEILPYTQKWYIMSVLTRRYSGSSESQLDRDIKRISEKGFLAYFKETEKTELNSEFWNTILPDNLYTTYILSPAFIIFTAAQIKNGAKSLFSSSKLIEDLIKIKADVHHIFPQAYLKNNGITLQSDINQICNYVYLESYDNKDISDEAPCDYFKEILNKCKTKNSFGYAKNSESFYKTLEDNCIPREIINYNYKDYDTFLEKRNIMIAKYIKRYYNSL